MDALKIYKAQLGHRERLTRAEETRYVRLAKQGDPEAWRRLLLASGYSVLNIANTYMGRGVDQMDLIQAGNIGFIKAVEKFQPHNAKNCRFDSYAH